MSGRGQGRGLAALAAALDVTVSPDTTDRQAPAAASPGPVESPAADPAVARESATVDADGATAPEAAPGPKVNREEPTPARRSAAVRSVPAPPPEAPTGEGPRYLRFEAKTVRMTAEQADELGQVEARLRRAARGRRVPGAELLTWNMVARAGIDLVLREAAAGRLTGLTEDELRASVGLDPLGF